MLRVVLSVIFCLAFFGCSKDNNKPVDPVTPVPVPAPVPAPVVEPTVVHFSFNSAKLDKVQKEVIEKALVGKTNVEVIKIVGNTDSAGPKKYNDKLSVKRAKAVKRYLKHLKVKAAIVVEGKGESNLLNADKTKAEQAANRRAEITFLLKSDFAVNVAKKAEKKVEKAKKVKKVKKVVTKKVEVKPEAPKVVAPVEVKAVQPEAVQPAAAPK